MKNSYYGAGNSSILLDDLRCSGEEESLLDCERDGEVGTHDCDHSEDAGVRCEGTCMYIPIYVYTSK